MFVIKGKNIPDLEIEVLGLDSHRTDLESVHDWLNHGALVTTREGVAGVDSSNFAFWAKHFVLSIK